MKPIRALLLCALLLGGCLFDSDETPSLESLWPNEDGSEWRYALARTEWGGYGLGPVYGSPGAVPPIPSMAEIAALLQTPWSGPTPASDSTSYSFAFDGVQVTESGASGQRVVTQVGGPPAARSGPSGEPGGEFLRRLRACRPDLRERLDAIAPPGPAPRSVEWEPLFLNGYAWERTDSVIGGYGDLSRELAWLYLTEDVRAGREFTLQLVPDLTDDVFLHGRFLPRATVSTPDGVFRRCVVCLYAVDYGIGESTDTSGLPLGYFRTFDYGTVAYAEDVGPVAGRERVSLTTGRPEGPGAGELTLGLTSYHPGRE